ncbi:hypothetical protein [Thiosocius teredinicola]|uniref:hypothetical protein n=1 Tax=Thiosocius teredinicola TaxID=1973002 RepID=UPI000990F99E
MPNTDVTVKNTGVPEGSYPVSLKLGWHGGLHLRAPQGADSVRAIADGEIVYARKPTARNDNVTDWLNYNPDGGSDPAWTDDGCVIIKHTTEIGAGAQNKPVEVTFLSIYMHLSKLLGVASRVAGGAKDRAVYRKDKIGMPGIVYGKNDQLHLEIVCDDENLKTLMGRNTGELSTASDGRTDVLYGDVYFQLPAGTQFFADKPGATEVTPKAKPAYTLKGTLDEIAPFISAKPDWGKLEEAWKTGKAQMPAAEFPLYVGLRYRAGDGPTNERGDAYLHSYVMQGHELGKPIVERDTEYELYQAATEISKAYPAGSRPAPSAVYELLRFGRVVGPDPLVPADVPHWREARYPGGTGWVNLNATGVKKFSDADFPQWRGWQLVDDDGDVDSRCESASIIGTIEDPHSWERIHNRLGLPALRMDSKTFPTLQGAERTLKRQELERRLAGADVRKTLERAVCKFPSEWDQATIRARWSWLKSDPEFKLEPIDWEDFVSHGTALAIDWGAANTGIPAKHWHFHPRAFVAHFRSNRWLSTDELERIYPNAASVKVTKYHVHLNLCTRKYGLTAPLRMAHFYGQAGVETLELKYMSELYNGNPHNYFRHYAKALNYKGWLGNVEWNDGGDFRGRGFKQLTGRANYANYWVYRGWLDPASFNDRWWRDLGWWGLSGTSLPKSSINNLPITNASVVSQLKMKMKPPAISNADVVANDEYTSIDTAGWFWASNTIAEIADTDDVAEVTRVIRGDSRSVGVTRPWPKQAHFPERQKKTQTVKSIIDDTI